MRNKILGGIGVVWGGLMLVKGFTSGLPAGSASYQAGYLFAMVFGAAMFLAGLYYLFRKTEKGDASR